MQLLWSKQFAEENPWEPEYDGVFHKYNGKVRFFFINRDGIAMIDENMEAARTVCRERVSLPANWLLVEKPEGSYLFFEKRIRDEIPHGDRAFDLRTLQMTKNTSKAVCLEYKALLKPMYYYEEAPFIHEEYCISHKGEWGYECTKNGEKIWQFRGHAYLYTDIYFHKDRVFFGTSGQGGYFYVLDLETGQVVAKVKTGGTKHIVRIEDQCYVLQSGKNASLVCVYLRDGQIKQILPLPGKAGYDAVIQRVGQQIHTITYGHKKDRMQHAYWSCIELP